MLTATYSLVAITNEHKATKNMLGKLQQGIRNILEKLPKVDLPLMKAIMNKLVQFDQHCRNRKVEVHLLPAIRTKAVTVPLLAELDFLAAAASDLLAWAHGKLSGMGHDMAESAREVCLSMQVYCRKMLERLAREEEHLFPLAERLLSMDEWFAMAAKFLSEDAMARQRRRDASHAQFMTQGSTSSHAPAL
ncbi:hypothetical protein [Noviherbaspirillum massiliense]|uniref:hypothetical protein n=2 Tax=Noviherbaspirillum massiliense TaxID=1465823 RepID=UPI0002E2B2CD|nr:hypothetical protein [Noviherbaspirillum massiliense]